VLGKVQKDIAAGNVTNLFKKGLAVYNAGNATGAIEYYDKALAIDPKDIRVLTYKGVALDALENHTGAIEY
jgi:Flp pilus assembly protein TadD